MSVRTPLRGSSRPDGIRAAAQLMRAAGPHADMVFAQLTPGETRAIQATMDDLPTDQIAGDTSALEAFLLETADERSANHDTSTSGIWPRLTREHAPVLAAMLRRESPQVAAWIVTQLEPQLAAHVVRMLGEETSLAILQRVISGNTPPQTVCTLIETSLEETLERVAPSSASDGHARVARIFDQLPDGDDSGLLDRLDAKTPGAGERVRALMFTFKDLVTLDPAGLQTLIASTPREMLVYALKGASPDLANAFYSNLTRRAGALIREELEALGPLRRSDIEAAQADIVDRARKLIQSGDIHLGAQADDDELVE